jgi:hypothetical protein
MSKPWTLLERNFVMGTPSKIAWNVPRNERERCAIVGVKLCSRTADARLVKCYQVVQSHLAGRSIERPKGEHYVQESDAIAHDAVACAANSSAADPEKGNPGDSVARYNYDLIDGRFIVTTGE